MELFGSGLCTLPALGFLYGVGAIAKNDKARYTAASRVYQNDHWFSDVFVGSALGFAIGRTILNKEK